MASDAMIGKQFQGVWGNKERGCNTSSESEFGPLEVRRDRVLGISAETSCSPQSMVEVSSATVVIKAKCLGGDDFDAVITMTVKGKSMRLVWDSAVVSDLVSEGLERCK